MLEADLVERIQRLSRDELKELARQIPGLWATVEIEKQEQFAEAKVTYRAEKTETKAREDLPPEKHGGLSREEIAARYKKPVQWTEHPWVVQVEGYQGGEPVILGTRVPVRVIAIAWVRHAMPIWEILENWDVNETQIYDALSYYYDHRDELDEIIREQEDIVHWMDEYPPGKQEES